MNKLILWIIKAAIIFIVLIAVTLAKEFGFPYAIAMIIGVSIIIPVWKYDPNKKAESESTELKKD